MSAVDETKQLAAALGRVPSGLYILTARRGDDETGVLASFVQQCSLRPPQVSVAVNRERYVADWLVPDASFVLNILEAGQTDMVARFGRGFAPGQAAFEGLEVERLKDKAIVLREALAYLRCQVVGRCPAGDHDLVIGQVIGGRLLQDGQPMVHIRKSGSHY